MKTITNRRSNGTKNTRSLRLGFAVAAAAIAMPIGSAAAAGPPEPAEYGMIERQCEAKKGSFFTNTHEGINLICSAPGFQDGAMPAQMWCDRMGGTFHFIQPVDPQSWRCHIPADD